MCGRSQQSFVRAEALWNLHLETSEKRNGHRPALSTLDLLQHFIAFEEDPDSGALHKIIAGYHQFHAVNAAVEETVRASGM